jgi:hypothetical protein
LFLVGARLFEVDEDYKVFRKLRCVMHPFSYPKSVFRDL